MDATLSYGLPRINASGTLLEGIALWGELRADRHRRGDPRPRARLLRLGGLHGPPRHPQPRRHHRRPRCSASRRCSRSARTVAPYLDLQLVAFPQDGLYRAPNGLANLHPRARHGRRRRRRHPAFRAHHGGGRRARSRALAEIAAERGLMLDLHCDETDDPLSRHIETLAAETQRLGLGGRVAGSHLTSMHSHGQLLRLEAPAADRRGRRRRDPQPADQHHPAGPPRHLSQAPRPDPGARRCAPTASPSAGARTACSTPGTRSAPPTCSTSPSWACTSRR